MAHRPLADDAARALGTLGAAGFVRTARRWSRVVGPIESTVAMVRNPSSFGLGDDICLETRVRLSNGRGYGFHRVDGTTTGGRNWWLKPDASDDALERTRICDEVVSFVGVEALPWIEERATPSGYVAHLQDDRVSYRLIEAYLAFGDDGALLDVLERGPQEGLPTNNMSRGLYAVPAEAALRAYEHLRRSPSSQWLAQARAVLASYRGRPPKAERGIFNDLKARVEAVSERP